VAAQAGLRVADTVVTNDRDTAAAFVAEHAATGRGVVTKMLASNSIVEDGQRYMAFTRPVSPADLEAPVGIETTTHLFQTRIEKAHDARVVVIGSRLFGFAIHATSEDSRIDFRRDYRAVRYERLDIPADVRDGVDGLMSALGLRFAAIDFVVDTEGRWVFIGDVNPGGQFGWLEAETRVPLTDALADLLTDRDASW
jgi:glutathione synthase/RimK-type ligase-like ATP-grasp enzyme